MSVDKDEYFESKKKKKYKKRYKKRVKFRKTPMDR